MIKIFLSYAQQDASEVASEFLSQLELMGFTIWHDSGNMRNGGRWKEQAAQLREAEAILVLLTPASVASEYVRWEWEYALVLQKRVIPLLIIPCTVPDELKRLQQYDLSEPNKYSFHFATLVRDLVGIVVPTSARETHPTMINSSKYTVYNAQKSAIGDQATVFNTPSPAYMNPNREDASMNLAQDNTPLPRPTSVVPSGNMGNINERETQERTTLFAVPIPSSMDVGIVIALKEEFAELYNEIENRCTPTRDSDTGGYYYLFEHLGAYSKQRYRCVATFVGEMGPGKAGLMTQRLISKWRPRTLVMLGIAAALSSDVRLGDVVIASQVDGYLENAKAVQGTDNIGYTFTLSGEVYRSSIDLLNFTRNFEFAHRKIFHSWQEHRADELQCLFPKENIEKLTASRLLSDKVQIIDGHIASGTIVGAAQAFTEWLKQIRDRKYLALEMEAAGFMAAVYEQADPKRTLVLRAISDYGDERKAELDKVGSGAFRRYAIRNAIQLLWVFFDAGILPYDEATTSQIMPGSGDTATVFTSDSFTIRAE